MDREKGPVFTVGGVKLREEIQGQGAPLREGDVGYIQYSVLRINGDLMFALGKNAELQRDEGEQYRMVSGPVKNRRFLSTWRQLPHDM